MKSVEANNISEWDEIDKILDIIYNSKADTYLKLSAIINENLKVLVEKLSNIKGPYNFNIQKLLKFLGEHIENLSKEYINSPKQYEKSVLEYNKSLIEYMGKIQKKMKAYELMRNEEKQKIEKEKSETKNEIALLKNKIEKLEELNGKLEKDNEKLQKNLSQIKTIIKITNFKSILSDYLNDCKDNNEIKELITKLIQDNNE